MSTLRIALTTGLFALGTLLCTAIAPGQYGGLAFADSADPNGPKCMCRFEGRRYALGEYACINSQLARCDMFLNNTSWTFLEDTCPTASLTPVPREAPVSLPARNG